VDGTRHRNGERVGRSEIEIEAGVEPHRGGGNGLIVALSEDSIVGLAEPGRARVSVAVPEIATTEVIRFDRNRTVAVAASGLTVVVAIQVIGGWKAFYDFFAWLVAGVESP